MSHASGTYYGMVIRCIGSPLSPSNIGFGSQINGCITVEGHGGTGHLEPATASAE